MRRTSIHVERAKHVNPIPAACRVANLLMSGLISGAEENGTMPPSVERQAELMFAQLRRILESAGATPEDVIKVNIWMQDRTQRAAINPPWLAMFPDEHSRPARQTMTADLDRGKLVQCDFVAVLGGSV